MSECALPWPFSTIGKELQLVNGFGFKPEQWRESGLPIIRIENLNDRFAVFDYVDQVLDNRFRVETGDLLFAWSGSRGTSFGPFLWNRGDAVLNQHIFNVRSKRDGLNKQFCYWWLKFLVSEIEQQAHGSAGLVHITRKELEKFRFPILPSQEQRRIAEILSTLDETIEQTEALIAKYQQIKAGLMHDLFTRGVTPDGKLRPTRVEASQLYKESPLGWIPKEWDVVELGTEIAIAHGFAFSGEFFADSPPGEILLTPGNFHRDGGLYFTRDNTKYFQGATPSETVLRNTKATGKRWPKDTKRCAKKPWPVASRSSKA